MCSNAIEKGETIPKAAQQPRRDDGLQCNRKTAMLKTRTKQAWGRKNNNVLPIMTQEIRCLEINFIGFTGQPLDIADVMHQICDITDCKEMWFVLIKSESKRLLAMGSDWFGNAPVTCLHMVRTIPYKDILDECSALVFYGTARVRKWQGYACDSTGSRDRANVRKSVAAVRRTRP